MSTQVESRQAIPTGTWQADPVHSDIGFSVDYMAGTFRGTFSKFQSELVSSDDSATLTGVAEVGSIQVKDENLEGHLQGPDFLDAERNPELCFRGTDFRRSGSDVTVAGELTIKGQTKPVELTGTIGDVIDDPFGGQRFGLRLETTIDRTEFDVRWNNPLPSGEPALASDVTLTADLQLVKAS